MVLISYAFTYAKSRFSHDTAHILAKFCFPEIPEWLRVYSKAPPEHDHKLKVRWLISRLTDALANNDATLD